LKPASLNIKIWGLNLTWATLHFVGWVDHTLSFVGFRYTQPNLHFISSIAQCETQQRPILEPSPASLTPNQRKALRLLAKTDGEAIFYAESLQRIGFNSGSVLSRALSSLLKRDIVTKNKSYHIQDVMLKNWALSNLPE